MFGNRAVTAVDRAVHRVRREDFLPDSQKRFCARDAPLPIGYAQTISQPSLVAEMTRELRLNARSRVLEVGTGSGYQTAILAEIAAQVFTIERIPELAEAARQRLEALGYRNIAFRVGDGAAGWAEDAPYDGIIVTAAATEVPAALPVQLKAGGRMVIPVGPDPNNPMLLLVAKDDSGEVREHVLFGVRFVPLVTGQPQKGAR